MGALPARDDDHGLLDAYSRAVSDAIDLVGPAVVRLEVGRAGSGSGFLISADGLAVTNSHVIRGAEHVRATLPDGRTARGEVIGGDLHRLLTEDCVGRPAPLVVLRGTERRQLIVVPWTDRAG